jgi:cysteinyl-tRNA synthetase
LLSAHYRQPLDWSDALVEQSVRTLDRLYGTLRELAGVAVPDRADLPAGIEAALCDDLNTPAALAELSGIAANARRATTEAERARLKSDLLAGAGILGLLQADPAAWFSRGGDADEDARIQGIVDARNAAKKARDFATADRLREELAREGVLLEDTAGGVRWRRG